MTQVRYEKINGKLKSVAGGANATSSSSSSSPLVPMPDEAVKAAAAEIFQRPRLTNRERLAVECLKPRSVGALTQTNHGGKFEHSLCYADTGRRAVRTRSTSASVKSRRASGG